MAGKAGACGSCPFSDSSAACAAAEEAPLPNPGPLTEEQRKLVKATVPVLQEHGTTITRKFYGNMIGENPELKNIFSHSKQMQGHQADALARSVLAYAENIDDLTPAIPLVERIAHKHASLHIVPAQYAIVGKYLLQAITDVVGAEVFSGALYDAWFAAYWQLAHICINREAELYAQAGWVGWREFVLQKRVKETDEITSFYLVPKDGKPLPTFKPGQYISVQKFVEKLGHYQSRQYSLSDTPAPDHLRISVKRESGIRATTPSGAVDTAAAAHPGWISNLLHDTLREGDVVELAFPFGEFVLDDSAAPLVLLSAGVGCTPLVSMLNTVVPAHPERRVSWVQVVRDAARHPFKAHVAALAEKHPNQLTRRTFYSDVATLAPGEADFAGRIDLAKVQDVLRLDDKTAQYYVCGPESFMADMIRDLKSRGVDSARIHAEVFGAADTPQ